MGSISVFSFFFPPQILCFVGDLNLIIGFGYCSSGFIGLLVFLLLNSKLMFYLFIIIIIFELGIMWVVVCIEKFKCFFCALGL